jgi:DNA-binding PadR family transcriptional regulator
LEIFVLAAVEAGLDTSYDLNKHADLSVGATLPLLARLKRSRLLRSKTGARRSKQYSLTDKGHSVLERSWRDLLEKIPPDFDAAVRVAYLAALMDRSLKATRQFLKAAAADRKRLSGKRQRDRERIKRESPQVAFGPGHRWLRAHSDCVRLEAEGVLLFRLADRKDLAEVLLPRTSLDRRAG